VPTPSCAAISDCFLVLSDELVDFLLVALSCSSSWAIAVQLISDIYVSVLKMFKPLSHTAGTHAGVSIHSMKLLTGDSC